jgi:secreted trypsin-like serine protease
MLVNMSFFFRGIANKIGTSRSLKDVYCGGSVIADEWILTAAHCMYDDNGKLLTPSQMFVFLNTWKLSSPNAQKEYIDVSQIIVHPQYDDYTIENDLALIKLKTNIKPITLPDQGDELLLGVGQKCTVSGWGYLNSAGTQLPDKLRKVEVEVISISTCNAPTWCDNEVLPGMFCAGYAAGVKDARDVDSGGPLFILEGRYTLE